MKINVKILIHWVISTCKQKVYDEMSDPDSLASISHMLIEVCTIWFIISHHP